MIEIVIIGKNEGMSIKKMRDSLIMYPCNRIWVLDRCTDNSELILSELGENYIKTPEKWQGRKTSSARNLGLSMCEPTSDVLFLDGDRFVVEGDLSQLENWNKDIALLLLENDLREDILNYNEHYRTIGNKFYSCGVFFKRKAINKLLGYFGEVFPTELQEYWGIEDLGIGDSSYRLGLTCDIYRKCRLNGGFDRMDVSPEAAKLRFDRINRIWK